MMISIRVSFAALLFVLQVLPLTSFALDLTGQSRTYLQSRETEDSTKVLPLYEYLDFKVENIVTQDVSFHFGGWARYDLKDEAFGKKTNSDLQYAYLSYRKSTGNAVLNLGRLFVREGVAFEQIDGAYARTDLQAGFNIAAFGGSPVETGPDNLKGDSVYGGRIGHGIADLYRIGLSYIQEKKGSADMRKEEGMDLWLHPAGKVELLGTSFYNALTSAWMQHAYYLTLGPFSKLTLRTIVTHVNYKDYFTAATMSAFQFQPGGLIDPNEKLTTAGEEASYPLAGNIIVSADYRKYDYEIAGSADYYGAKLMRSEPQNWGAGLFVHRMNGDTDALRYYEYRAYGYKKFGKADVTADVLAVSYDAAINGVSEAYSASLAGGYMVAERARLAADVEYAKNPFFDKEVKGLVKFVYNFSLPGSKGGQ